MIIVIEKICQDLHDYSPWIVIKKKKEKWMCFIKFASLQHWKCCCSVMHNGIESERKKTSLEENKNTNVIQIEDYIIYYDTIWHPPLVEKKKERQFILCLLFLV